MEKIINRRNIIRNSIAAATAVAMPATTKAEAPAPALPQSLIDNPPTVYSDSAMALVSRMQSDMEGVNIMEVTGDGNAPHYRKGDLVFVKPGMVRPSDHVYLVRKTGQSVFGTFVHCDAKAVYVRGFKSGERMQALPLKSIASWGKVIISYRA